MTSSLLNTDICVSVIFSPVFAARTSSKRNNFRTVETATVHGKSLHDERAISELNGERTTQFLSLL